MSNINLIGNTCPVIPTAEKYKNEYDYQSTFLMYYNMLSELFISSFEWENLPDYMYNNGALEYLERTLTMSGKCLFFHDELLNKYLLYDYTSKDVNFYGFSNNFMVNNPIGYHNNKLNRSNSVEIFNSVMKTGELNVIINFAEKLTLCDMIISLNISAMKVPNIIRINDYNQLSYKNFMNKVNSYEPNIYVDDKFNEENIKVFDLKTPFIAEDVYRLKEYIKKEVLKYIGISAENVKAERVGMQEQYDFNAETNAFINTRYAQRKKAAIEINNKFNLDIKVKLRDDLIEKGGVLDGDLHNADERYRENTSGSIK